MRLAIWTGETGSFLPNGERQIEEEYINMSAMRNEFYENSKETPEIAYVESLVLSVYQGTQCMKHYGKIDCIIIINVCSNFFPEIQNGAFCFVKVFLLFLFEICNVLTICKFRLFRAVSAEYFFPRSYGRTSLPSHRTTCLIRVISCNSKKKTRMSFGKARLNIVGPLMFGLK